MRQVTTSRADVDCRASAERSGQTHHLRADGAPARGICPDYELQPPNDKSLALVAVVNQVAAIDFAAKPRAI